MSEAIEVRDVDDPRLDEYVALNDPRERRAREQRDGFFVAESPHVVHRLVTSGRVVRSVLVTPQQHEALAAVLDPLAAPVYVAPLDVLRAVVGFDLHRGAVASADRWAPPDPPEILRDARRIVVCQGCNDHENLGVLFRSSAALGADALALDHTTADPFYRRCVRVSIGLVCTLPWTRVDSLDALHDLGFTTVALTPSTDAVPLADVDWPARSAIVVGAEGPGLTADWLARATVRARIPMQREVDSLNLATAASIALYASTVSG